MIKIVNRGPIILDIMGTSLTDDDVEVLLNPLVCGVILFTRNFDNINQLRSLVKDIKNLRFPALLVAVDHEGGRVQRFKDGFTSLPSMLSLANIIDKEGIEYAKSFTKNIGLVLACELRSCGVDFSFTPVLDLNWGNSKVIGSRSFSDNPDIVSILAKSLVDGLNLGGMSSCGKHFPGHGFVSIDSHLDIPNDKRKLKEIKIDIIPFKKLIKHGMEAVMPAHVIYSKLDRYPAGFSKYWLNYLRKKLQFKGVIISDDLNMKGAHVVGDINSRYTQALDAGCDMVLICNDRKSVLEVLDAQQKIINKDRQCYLLEGKGDVKFYQDFVANEEFIALQEYINSFTKDNIDFIY